MNLSQPFSYNPLPFRKDEFMKRLVTALMIALCSVACGSSSPTAPSAATGPSGLQPPSVNIPPGSIAETFSGSMSPGDQRCSLDFGSGLLLDEGPCAVYTFTFTSVPGSISADVVGDTSLIFPELYEVSAKRVLASGDATSLLNRTTHFDSSITRAGTYQVRVTLPGTASSRSSFVMVVVHSKL